MSTSSGFDEAMIRQLAAILHETDLSEIECEKDGCRVRVARQMGATMVHAPLPATPLPQAANVSTAAVEAAPPAGLSVKSPMVGTAYAASGPGTGPFIQVGSVVTKGQTLLIIEAMKVMNQIRAPQDGTVVQILFHDGDPVEYDQPLVVLS